jgi:aminoglycoside phosphotransferase (APT) family kinase protein
MLDLNFASHLDDVEVTRIIRAYPAYSGLEARIGSLLEIRSINPITYQAITSNGNFIFRFPPDIQSYHLLKKEERIQKGFNNWTNLRIPETLVYDDVNNFPVFAVHTMIPGKPLAASLYERLSPGARYRMITDLANFFNQAHRVPLPLACKWLEIQDWGDNTAEILAPVYGKPAWFEPKAITSIGLALSKVLDEDQINLFNQTVELFEELDTDAHNLVFGHGDLHGYNMAIEEDEFGPKLTGVFDLGCAGILDVHEDFFRLSLISEDLLERVMHIYQNFSNQKRNLNRQRLAIYYRAFLFYLMAEQAEEDLKPLTALLLKHVEYYENSYGKLR